MAKLNILYAVVYPQVLRNLKTSWKPTGVIELNIINFHKVIRMEGTLL